MPNLRRRILKQTLDVRQSLEHIYRELRNLADFYNYFQYGIDFLISGTTHIVKKIILHTNIVGLSPRSYVHPVNFG